MQEALEAEELPVLGVIPILVRYERAFGETPADLDEYRAALQEFLR